MKPSSSTPPAPQTVGYTVRSSDVLSESRVNVVEENSERVIWYKERFLADNEIIEHLVDNASSTLLWEIHRPLRGWYIRLRSPSFPRNVFVPLIPVPPSSPYHSPGSLKFSCRTNVVAPLSSPVSASQPSPSSRVPVRSHSFMDSDATLTDGTSGQFSPTHTYPPPPTPPSMLVSPPSPSAVHAKLDQLTQTRSVVSQFILSPHSHAIAAPAPGGLFSRAFRALRNNAPTHANSFSLSPLPDGPPPAPEEHVHHHHLHLARAASGPVPFLVFHDTTSVLSVGSSTGVFEIHLDEVGKLGVDLSFWIAIALAYGEFLGDREGYLAAAAD
ncbi:hypothetical protein B0F90DRAFT_1210793 [Multifurca ochricompacta]|uniref:Uncharacterized protein n=1 Tax=Multifurca ochricompacta TaxID=376703 RepID=A0AAD4LYH8_9AGAM|nr:hypothetical protein B0F90DRAFT_1210793 [Multifurca ochricompacta]